jgi:hypothetical protein
LIRHLNSAYPQVTSLISAVPHVDPPHHSPVPIYIAYGLMALGLVLAFIAWRMGR